MKSPISSAHSAANHVALNGTETVDFYSSVEEELTCLRRGVVVSDNAHISVIRVAGEHAYDVVDRLLPCDLFLRDGQARQTLILSDQGIIEADVTVACDDDAYWLFVDGLDAETVVGLLTERRLENEQAEIENASREHALISVGGPFAWELMGAFDSPGLAGLRYMTLAHLRSGCLCLRAGKTGEYGYDLLVHRDEALATWEKLMEIGTRFDARPAGVGALHVASLQNWFFNIHGEGKEGLNPIEAQLQWRVSRQKEFRGSAELDVVRQRGIEQRITAIKGEAFSMGDTVVHQAEAIGRVVAATDCPQIGSHVGLALMDLDWAHSGLQYQIGEASVQTVSPPFVNNLSMVVKPQLHTWANRDALEKPPGVL